MTKNLKEFLQKLCTDDNLVKEFETLQNEEDKNEVITKTIELAKSAGYTLTEADFEEPQGGLDDEELMAVSGGIPIAGITKACGCVAGGGGEGCNCAFGGSGESYTNDSVCACVVSGYGYDQDGNNRCACIAIGGGTSRD